ncbi:MAG: HEAT repeat domain-containing protein [Promethearchaeota archaeon]
MGNRNDYNNPYRIRNEQGQPEQRSSPRAPLDFSIHRICPACGKIIKITHSFCKFCGTNISSISPIGRSDEVTKTLSDTAVSDPNPDVRKSAVASIGEFGENDIIGLLSYILMNDPDESVRIEAASELGKLHHPYSLDVLAKALKDKSALVRKEAIEGLKNIKKMTKKRESSEENNHSEAELRDIIQEEPISSKPNETSEENTDNIDETEKIDDASDVEPLEKFDSEEKDFYEL